MKIEKDTRGQSYIEWEQAAGGCKRAWIQRKTDPKKDWAKIPGGRYLNVVRIKKLGAGPGGNPTDFPISSKLTDEQVLVAFVTAASEITGCPLR